VFACRHIKTGTLYALKEIPKKLIQQNLMEDQLIREIKLQSYFHHSNLVKLYGFFSDETNIYLLMEYMEEGTLYTLLKKNKKFPEQYVSDRIR
jgi:aurora kinase